MKRGFTLVEILVVIGVIGLLAGVVLTSMGGRKDSVYKVKFDGWNYYVNEYKNEDDGRCVYLPEKGLRFCGEWSVRELNNEK